MKLEVLKARMQRCWRAQRMKALVETLKLQPGTRIIDLGGLPQLWETLDLDLDITLVNFRDQFQKISGSFKQTYHFVEADACNLTEFADGAFDLVFSNSVIEHVGSEERQAAFAQNVRRLAPQYWVQTPSRWFPLEAHCNLPFWWFYPSSLKQSWIRRWQRQGQNFKWRQMADTHVLTRKQLLSLFPDSQIYVEYVAGFPKSYSMYKT